MVAGRAAPGQAAVEGTSVCVIVCVCVCVCVFVCVCVCVTTDSMVASSILVVELSGQIAGKQQAHPAHAAATKRPSCPERTPALESTGSNTPALDHTSDLSRVTPGQNTAGTSGVIHH